MCIRDRINPSFTMLARGFMTIEGVVADLSPTTNIVKIVSDHIQKKTLTLDAMLQKMKEMGIQLSLIHICIAGIAVVSAIFAQDDLAGAVTRLSKVAEAL